MKFFRRNKSINDASSASVSKPRTRTSGLRSYLSKKDQKPQPNVGSIPSATKDSPAQGTPHKSNSQSATIPSHHLPNVHEEENIKSLWDCAYDAVKKENPELVTKYEKLLSTELLEKDSEPDEDPLKQAKKTLDQTDNIIDSKLLNRRAQLKAIITCGQQRMDARKTGLQDTIAHGVEFLLWGKDLIGEAVKASPEASVAWAGVCIVLPLLTNASTADKANRDGFAYVTTRMNYYVALEPLLLQVSHDSASVTVNQNLVLEIKKHIIELYQHILDFQFRSVLRFYRSHYKNFGRDSIQHENWSEMKTAITDLDKNVRKDLGQMNALVSTQELENLSAKADQSLSNMQHLLSIAKEQLGVIKEHLNISSKQLQVQEEIVKKMLTKDEEKCHQIFRLTKDNKDESYEWYKNRVEDRVEGTCQWFLNHEHFKTWLKQDSGPLLVTADPGCGKSVLAKYLIDDGLPKLPSATTICYFFFKDQDQDTVKQALCALLHQLFSHKPSLIRHAMPEFRDNGPSLAGITELLWKILEKAGADPEAGPVIFVLDALDECEGKQFDVLVSMLNRHIQKDKKEIGKMKFLLTCRPYDSLTSQFHGPVNIFRIPGEEDSESIGKEVSSVIIHRVNQLGEEKKLEPHIKAHLQEELLKITHRTYLWVYLVFDHLESITFKKTNKGVDVAIKALPKSVNQAYEKILSKSENYLMVRKALCIVLAAHRPLTLAEMNIALNIDTVSRPIEYPDLETDENFKGTIRNWCGLFISIHHNKVYFLHQTAREFLLTKLSSLVKIETEGSSWQDSISIQESHSVLATSCIRYLELFNHETVVSPDEDESTCLHMDRDIFLDYSAENWAHHFREARTSSDEKLVHSVLQICGPDSKSCLTWGKIYWSSRYYDYTECHTTIIIASYFGLDEIVKLLLERDADIESKDSEYGQTPLSWAAKNGYDAVVKLLLEKGADIDSKDSYARTPLLWAADNGRDAVVKLLLEKGADIESKDSEYGQTPLSWAAENGRDAVVKLLLEKGADIESKDSKYGRTPLSWAAKNGYDTVVKLLLERGADIESKDSEYGQTPLSWAAKMGHDAVVKLLLEKGADTESKDRYARTPLSLAAENGRDAVVKLLLEKGADIESKDSKYGQTPLSWAAKNGYDAVVKLLLEKGADTESKDNRHLTPLLWAVRDGYDAVVKLLLEKGADIESKDRYGQTPLSWAAKMGHDTVVKLLLEEGADTESKDSEYGRTPLSWAAEYRHDAVVKLLEQVQVLLL
ncbi:putative ankyrin repeat protein [Botrytis cinerea BcDW1]|uniref:Putative ankyrin repeat protein n=1 Tax=Botryotinia fuckeliana (strain BcDW1) TaxID=1290391 RepID=M7TVM0_BOTF1|nr:putative ankyrin repeat protein [Botrytis cinerea BcDW1]